MQNGQAGSDGGLRLNLDARIDPDERHAEQVDELQHLTEERQSHPPGSGAEAIPDHRQSGRVSVDDSDEYAPDRPAVIAEPAVVLKVSFQVLEHQIPGM